MPRGVASSSTIISTPSCWDFCRLANLTKALLLNIHGVTPHDDDSVLFVLISAAKLLDDQTLSRVTDFVRVNVLHDGLVLRAFTIRSGEQIHVSCQRYSLVSVVNVLCSNITMLRSQDVPRDHGSQRHGEFANDQSGELLGTHLIPDLALYHSTDKTLLFLLTRACQRLYQMGWLAEGSGAARAPSGQL